MKNIVELIAQIRFQLFQLASKNAHHDFEHLCRHLARARICSNILPATGPVSAGGDQGKDFETFRTYLNNHLNNNAFIGLTSEKPLAFACTIQKAKIDAKIKSDVKTILDGDPDIEGIHYLLTQDVPVSKRHELQKWCEDEHSTKLEIYDGQAVAELLSEYDVFWIAERYLSIPNDLYPKRQDDINWYSILRDKWKSDESEELNYSDFFEIKSAIRAATFNDKYKSDLIFWISKLKILFSDDIFLNLRRKAIYETVVASLRGLGNLECSFDDIDKYFESIESISTPYDIDEAEILINYCVGASRHNVFSYDAGKLIRYKKELNDKIDECIKNETSLTNTCVLYEIKGNTFVAPNPIGKDNYDFDEAIGYWNRVADLAEKCPLYPLDRFIDRVTNTIDIFYPFLEGYFEKFESLTIKLDTLIEKRYGGFAAAEKARDRALKYHSNGAITRAIKQLHISKVNWFADETLKGSVVSCFLIASWYDELKLIYAAKYYYLAVAFITIESPKSELKKYLSQALIRLAEIDYINGNWCSYIDFTEIGMIGYNIYSDKSAAADGTDELSRIIFHTSILLTITKQIKPELYDNLLKNIDRWGLNEYLSESLPLAQENFIHEDKSKLWAELRTNYKSIPFNDIGNPRTICWVGLGIEWELKFTNDYCTMPIAEQFAAISQILICDLSNVDLFLLRTKVSIEISVAEETEYEIVPVPSNKGRQWEIKFPYYKEILKSNFDDIQTFCITAITEIFFEVSLKPYNELLTTLERSFKDGLSLKVFIAQPYELIYRKFISQELFNKIPRDNFEPPKSPKPFLLDSHPLLGWKSDLSETYSEDQAKEALRNRYKYAPKSIRFTLPELLKSSEFINTVKRLKSNGWKDWHILNSIASITLNYRIQQLPSIKNNPEKMREYMFEQMFKPELEEAIKVPHSNYSEDKIIFYHNSNMLSTLKVLGLECRQVTPDFNAINDFLKFRFNYWEDDIEHENIFP